MRQDHALYTAHSPDDIADICRRLRALPISKQGLDVFVRRHKLRRTNAQNARLQWLCAAHAGWLNQERLRLIATGVLPAYWPEVDGNAVRCSIFNPLYCGTDSSTKPSKADMADILTRYEADLIEQGVKLPSFEPDPW